MIEGPPPGVRTLADLIATSAERHGTREALVAGGRRWTYTRLADETARVGSGLLELGLERGERVGVLLPNGPEFFSTALGIQAAGGTAVCLNTMATGEELRHYVERTGLRWLVYVPRFLKHDYRVPIEALSKMPSGEDRWTARIAVCAEGEVPPGHVGHARLGAGTSCGLRDLAARVPIDAEEPAAIFFTSGSTSRPKAVVHAHRALVHQAYVLGDAFGVTPDDRAWGCLPMFFTGGFVAIGLVTLAAGGAVVLQDHFEAGPALDLLEGERVTFYAGWQQALALCDHESFPRRRLCLRKGMYADSPVTERLLARDHVSIQGYGLSETATLVCAARWDDPPELRKRGHGRPLPGVEIAFVDARTGNRRAPGEVGEVRLRGPSLMLGYLDVPREEHFDADGFFRTGDLGCLDETGTLQFEGRLKDVIRTAGVNVAAAEVEAFLTSLPGVRAAYVVGVPDHARGENVAAFLVPEAGRGVAAAAVQTRCREALASYKVPRHLFLLELEAVPRTGTQKVDKPQLRLDAARWAGGPRDLLAAGATAADEPRRV